MQPWRMRKYFYLGAGSAVGGCWQQEGSSTPGKEGFSISELHKYGLVLLESPKLDLDVFVLKLLNAIALAPKPAREMLGGEGGWRG